MSNMDWKEVEAASVEEATREALEQLGAREDEVTIEVIATPRAGVLGLGARQARVRVTRKDAARAGANPPASSEAGQPGQALQREQRFATKQPFALERPRPASRVERSEQQRASRAVKHQG